MSRPVPARRAVRGVAAVGLQGPATIHRPAGGARSLVATRTVRCRTWAGYCTTSKSSRLTAAMVLADLAEKYANEVPEFAEVRGALLGLLKDQTESRELRREAGRALGRLGRYADEETATAFGRYVGELEAAWEAYENQLAAQLRIPPGKFRLPPQVQAKLNRAPLPEPVPPSAPRVEYAWLSRKCAPPSPGPADSRGPGTLRATPSRRQDSPGTRRKLWGEHDVISARMTAAKALAFRRRVGRTRIEHRHPRCCGRAPRSGRTQNGCWWSPLILGWPGVAP